MAEKKEAEVAKDGAGKAPAKKSKKLLVLVGAVVALLALAGGGAWFFLKGKEPPPETAEVGKDGKPVEKKDDAKKEEKKVPYFVEFESFTSNLKDPERFMQIKLTFQVKTPEAAEQLKDLMPMVRNAIIPVLSAQETAVVLTREGKDKMTAAIVAAASEALANTAAADQIDTVLVTHMIIQ
jgi:flagellar FliL protein